MLPELRCRRALLLQGPMGPFFRRFADELTSHGVEVTKVNFNAGDGLFFGGPRALAYRGNREQWPAYLRELLRARDIDGLFLFGDFRPLHRAAIAIARELGIAVWVFEEGYLRPDFITLERDGVNARSPLPREPHAYLSEQLDAPEPRPVGSHSFALGAWYSVLYALALTLFGFFYPRYVHHRPLNAWLEAFRWVRSGVRKQWFSFRERSVLARLAGPRAGKYFLVSLQVHCDAQLEGSRFGSVEGFIEHVARSFSEHGRAEDALVIKHHPMDRAYREYGPLIAQLAQRYGLGERLCYVHDLHLPTLLRHARGAAMINSTVGLSALSHGIPVKLLGAAIYDLPGLTHQGTLESFWHEPAPVDATLLGAFRGFLLRYNQVAGSFYVRAPGASGAAGIHWFEGSPPHSQSVVNVP